MLHKWWLSGIIIFCCTNITDAQNRKIIDVHFHTRSAGDYGMPAPANPMTGKLPHASTNEEILKTNLALLKKYHVVKAICSGTLVRNKDYQKQDPLLFLSALEYPDHQNNPLPDTATFKKQIADHLFMAFGELGLQYEGKTLDDPLFEPYLAICEKQNIPVAVHTGVAAPNTPYTCCPGFRVAAGKPISIEPVLIKHPKLKVQLMHMGCPFLEETKAMLNVYPQLYVDISAIDWIVPVAEFYAYLKALITAGFEDRIMYGSDQMIWEDAIPLSIQNVEKAPFLSNAQKEKIFYGNAARFYNIH